MDGCGGQHHEGSLHTSGAEPGTDVDHDGIRVRGREVTDAIVEHRRAQRLLADHVPGHIEAREVAVDLAGLAPRTAANQSGSTDGACRSWFVEGLSAAQRHEHRNHAERTSSLLTMLISV
jgi:hypothetical protein